MIPHHQCLTADRVNLATTSLYALPFALINGFLVANTLFARATTKTYFGLRRSQPPTDANPTDASKSKRLSGKSPITDFDPLEVAWRTHQNFLENVPLALIFAAFVELQGGNKARLGAVLMGLLGLRVSHAVGLMTNWQQARALGFFGSFASVVGLAGWASWLGYNA